MIVTPTYNQTLLDVLLQYTGSTEQLVAIMIANGITDLCNLPDSIDIGEVVKPKIVSFYIQNSREVVNGDTSALDELNGFQFTDGDSVSDSNDNNFITA